MRKVAVFIIPISMILFSACAGNINIPRSEDAGEVPADTFKYYVEQFDDIRILRYRLPDFDKLTLQEKTYIYYLSQATLAGRDIFWDQNFKYNLLVRKTIEGIIDSYSGDKENNDYKAFLKYAKKVFFASGIHHHYSMDKFKPEFTEDYLRILIGKSEPSKLPLVQNQTPDQLADLISSIIFNEKFYARKVEQRAGADMVKESAVNFYEGVSQKEVEDFYSGKIRKDDPHPISLGLNSKLEKLNGKIVEDVYKSDGKYGPAIDEIINWLGKARDVAETDAQKKELQLLIEYYRTGDLKKWDDYNVAWARDTDPIVDYNNGFIEVYDDPMGMKASWEAIVDYLDPEASKRTKIITENAQWFENNAPIQPQYRKEEVTGIAARVINIAMLGGACYPTSPLGINLPNADWIRKEVGSKSVTLANITNAYDVASRGNGFLEEFSADKEEVDRVKKYGTLADELHTDLHECVGHASGKLAPGTDPNSLKNYASTLEEARADLFALYFMMDKKLVDLGLFPNEEAPKAGYDSYIRNGLLTQIVRIKPGKDIEEAHMRNRALICHWVYEKGKGDNVISMLDRNGETFVKINDYKKLQLLFGELLKEIQRIKSEGDFEAGRNLVENYGVKIDSDLHTQMLDRYAKLNLAPYSGFLNPYLTPRYDEKGNITDISLEYTDDYIGQMMYYGKNYSFLPLN